MNFEDKLKEVVDQYERLVNEDPFLETEGRTLFQNAFQAKEVKFEEEQTKISLVAPGLQTHQGVNGMWEESAVSYEGRRGRSTLSPEENGFVGMYLMLGEEGNPKRVEKIVLDFSNRINFPQNGKYNAPRTEFLFESERGMMIADCEEGKGRYYQKTQGGKEWLGLGIALNNRAITWMSFNVPILGKNVVTSFFEDMGYTGLDLLIE